MTELWSFLVSYGMGLTVGFAAGWSIANSLWRKKVDDWLLEKIEKYEDKPHDRFRHDHRSFPR